VHVDVVWFKYGQPHANYYFDVGFIKNPARDKRWGFFAAVDEEMKEFVLTQRTAAGFVQAVLPVLSFLVRVDQEQIFAFGCNAGRHRSPVIVEVLADRLRKVGINCNVVHRELAR